MVRLMVREKKGLTIGNCDFFACFNFKKCEISSSQILVQSKPIRYPRQPVLRRM